MSKIEEIVTEFADLNLKIIKNIKERGYSNADKETLEVVRENIMAISSFNLRVGFSAQEEKATKTGD